MAKRRNRHNRRNRRNRKSASGTDLPHGLTAPVPVEPEEELERLLREPVEPVHLPRATSPSRHPVPSWLPEDVRQRVSHFHDTPEARRFSVRDVQIAAWMGRIYPGHHYCFHKGCRRARRCMWKPDKVPPAEWGVAEWRLYGAFRYILPHCIIPLWEHGFGDFIRLLMREQKERLVSRGKAR